MTIYAEEETNSDGHTIFDVEKAALTGKIIERQKDHHTKEWKYLIAGSAIDERATNVVAKLSVTDKLVIITVYLGN